MPQATLTDIAILLAALAIAAPLARALGIGTVLGYLIAGALVGPFGIRGIFTTTEAKDILHMAEFGIVLLLFLIGLEVRPRRLWSMRSAIFGLGGLQVLVSAVVLAGIGMLLKLDWNTALFAGFALALSSTAFALQVLEEQGDLNLRHGRMAFSVLLFQDLAAIPLIALAPLFAVNGVAGGMDLLAAAKALGTIVAVVIAGHFALDYLIRLVALTGVREAMTAAALLTVVGVAIIMQQVGVSSSLGAFIAGALLAESSYRHQLQADIGPFEGLLLGLFFTAIGMSLNLGLLKREWQLVLLLTAVLVIVKTVVLYGLGRRQGLDGRASRRLGLALSQGGEFAFVLFSAGIGAGVMSKSLSEILTLVVTLSMAATPLLLRIDGMLTGRRRVHPADFETPQSNQGHVVIAGFGRYGQIIARILRGKKIPFTALDISAEQVELVRKFGAQAFYGDASRIDVLEAAQMDKAKAFVLAIDDVDASLRTAEIVTSRWPKIPVYARARNRAHAHRLIDLGVEIIQRETLHSALETARQLLKGLGYSEGSAGRTIDTFRAHDHRRLIEDYKHYTDQEKLQARAKSDAAMLEQLFAEDEREEARLARKQTQAGEGQR
jgi:glutathione-regulated potassium-efflux system protein KefB